MGEYLAKSIGLQILNQLLLRSVQQQLSKTLKNQTLTAVINQVKTTEATAAMQFSAQVMVSSALNGKKDGTGLASK